MILALIYTSNREASSMTGIWMVDLLIQDPEMTVPPDEVTINGIRGIMACATGVMEGDQVRWIVMVFAGMRDYSIVPE